MSSKTDLSKTAQLLDITANQEGSEDQLSLHVEYRSSAPNQPSGNF